MSVTASATATSDAVGRRKATRASSNGRSNPWHRTFCECKGFGRAAVAVALRIREHLHDARPFACGPTVFTARGTAAPLLCEAAGGRRTRYLETSKGSLRMCGSAPERTLAALRTRRAGPLFTVLRMRCCEGSIGLLPRQREGVQAAVAQRLPAALYVRWQSKRARGRVAKTESHRARPRSFFPKSNIACRGTNCRCQKVPYSHTGPGSPITHRTRSSIRPWSRASRMSARHNELQRAWQYECHKRRLQRVAISRPLLTDCSTVNCSELLGHCASVGHAAQLSSRG